MKALLKFAFAMVVLGGVTFVAYHYGKDYIQLGTKQEYRTVPVTRGEIVSVVTATGTIRPVVTVQVGAFVSGQIGEIYVDFNDRVEEGDLLAEIDPRTYESHVARDKATLATAKADFKRVKALLEQATTEEARAKAVKTDNPDFVSDVELDNVKYQRMSLEAQLEVAQANVEQAEATLQNSTANLEYTKIRAPASGIIIDRKIEPGQTLASQFQVPQLFEIAQDMDEVMHIMASIDESDIGTIVEASESNKPVRFTVDAYPGKKFEGKVIQIRSSSNARENIVTYPVIVSTPNTDGKLLPGMTANLEFETEVIKDCMRIPNTALRFFPSVDQIAEEYRKEFEEATGNQRTSFMSLTGTLAPEEDEESQDRAERVVWIQEGNFVRPIKVVVGSSNQAFTELLEGDLKEGDLLVDAALTAP